VKQWAFHPHRGVFVASVRKKMEEGKKLANNLQERKKSANFAVL